MQTIIKFLLMGGYASYIWSAYTIALTILVANICWSQHLTNKVMRNLTLWLREDK